MYAATLKLTTDHNVIAMTGRVSDTMYGRNAWLFLLAFRNLSHARFTGSCSLSWLSDQCSEICQTQPAHFLWSLHVTILVMLESLSEAASC